MTLTNLPADAAVGAGTRPAQPAAPVSPSRGAVRPLGLDEVRITGGIWERMQRLNAEVILAHCYDWMDRLGWIGNFDDAARGVEAAHAGIEFVDSEVYKWLEAAAWQLGNDRDPDLEARYESVVKRVAAAQRPDGYLHTSFGGPGQRPRYSDFEWGHELYCFGHLLQAAVARLRTRHDDTLPLVARRLADHLVEQFGPGGTDAICGHPELEMALAEFGRATGDERYVALAHDLVERRGAGRLATTIFHDHDYFLDDQPVREATVLRGHAVRAVYLAAGAVDVAVEFGDGALLGAVREQWANTVARRTYLTGGIGAHHQNEEFGKDYELPADRAYAETCAAIGFAMLSWRLLLESGEAVYADLIERTLLNGILVSPREDGRAFFYANTLHQRSASDRHGEGLSGQAEADLRAPWFEVSCCPTNVARTLASVAAYTASVDGGGLQIHQYAPMEIETTLDDGRAVGFEVRTDYPFDGVIEVLATRPVSEPFTLSLRVPPWARGSASLFVNGAPVAFEGSAAKVERAFEVGDLVRLSIPVEPRFTRAHPSIDAVRGQLAVERGPLVLALEDLDLPPGMDVSEISIDPAFGLRSDPRGATATFRAERHPGVEWPYGDIHRRAGAPFEATLIPYFAWANRGPSTMRVWMPVVDHEASS